VGLENTVTANTAVLAVTSTQFEEKTFCTEHNIPDFNPPVLLAKNTTEKTKQEIISFISTAFWEILSSFHSRSIQNQLGALDGIHRVSQNKQCEAVSTRPPTTPE